MVEISERIRTAMGIGTRPPEEDTTGAIAVDVDVDVDGRAPSPDDEPVSVD